MCLQEAACGTCSALGGRVALGRASSSDPLANFLLRKLLSLMQILLQESAFSHCHAWCKFLLADDDGTEDNQTCTTKMKVLLSKGHTG